MCLELYWHSIQVLLNERACLLQLAFLRQNKKGVTTLNIINPENEGIGECISAL